MISLTLKIASFVPIHVIATNHGVNWAFAGGFAVALIWVAIDKHLPKL